MKHVLPSIMVILVCLSNGYCVNTDHIVAFHEESMMVFIKPIGLTFNWNQTYDRLVVTKEDIQNIKDAMGVYEKEEGQ